MDYLLEQALVKTLEEQLPQATAGALKTYIEKAQKVEDRLLGLENQLKLGQAELAQLQKTNAAYFAELTELRKLKADVDRVFATERDLKVTLAEKDKLCAESKVALMEKLVGAVFRNPQLKVTESANVPVAVSGGGNCTGYAQTMTSSKTTTTELE